MATERRSDPKRSQGARVATVARRQAQAAKRPLPLNLESLARSIGATYNTGVQL